MSFTLFLSDVHLSAERPRIVGKFLSLLDGEARRADALYILGDLFDQWLGDDDDTPPHLEVVASLRALADSGVPVTLIHGNHDFLLGGEFARRAGCTILSEPAVAQIYGTPVTSAGFSPCPWRSAGRMPHPCATLPGAYPGSSPRRSWT